jgi:hypothetical protein
MKREVGNKLQSQMIGKNLPNSALLRVISMRKTVLPADDLSRRPPAEELIKKRFAVQDSHRKFPARP